MADMIFEDSGDTTAGTVPVSQWTEKAVANTILTKASRVLEQGVVKESAVGIPQPEATPESLYRTASAMKMALEQLTRQRGNRSKSVLYVEELGSLFTVVIRELDRRYGKSGTDTEGGGVITDPDGGDDITDASLQAVINALNSHVSNTDIHFNDAPSPGAYLRALGAWVQGMTVPEIEAYVASQIALIPTDGLTAVQDDPAPVLGGNLNLNNHAFTGNFVAGENLASGDLCYLDTNGAMSKADAKASDTSRSLLAIVTSPLNAGFTGTFIIKGFINATAGVPGDVLYVGTTPGIYQTTRPFGVGDIIRVIGYSVATTRVFFDPDKTWAEVQPA